MGTRERIVILTQNPQVQELFQEAVDNERTVIVQADRVKVLRPVLERTPSIVVLDLELPSSDLEQAAEYLSSYPDLPVMLLAGKKETGRIALDMWHSNAPERTIEEVVHLPVDTGLLQHSVTAICQKGRFLRGETLVGHSSAIRRLREQVLRVACTPVSTVLLIGETGAGKDIVAESLHRFSERAEAPFIPINCAAIPENLLESELFGHERGAFTDAKNQRRGLFERANGGTVFLDEIGEMSQAAQIRLLRVLEERQVTRVGSNDTIPVDIRVIAATNRSLRDAVSQKEFRLDLYHRLKVVTLDIPPLRDRPEDIPVLIKHFVNLFSNGRQAGFQGLTQAAMDVLLRYDWPGNVRELRNLVESLTFLGPRRPVEPQDLVPLLERPPDIDRHLPVPTGRSPDQSERELIYFALLDLKRELAEVRRILEEQASRPSASAAPVYQLEAADDLLTENEYSNSRAVEPLRTLKELEKEAIEAALARVSGNRKQAAGVLGISPRTLYRKLDEYGLR